MGPRNLPGHSRFGEPTGFGGFTGHSRMGELDGPGNFLRHQPFGEPFGSNNSGHPRLGEPGFRSSYSATVSAVNCFCQSWFSLCSPLPPGCFCCYGMQDCQSPNCLIIYANECFVA